MFDTQPTAGNANNPEKLIHPGTSKSRNIDKDTTMDQNVINQARSDDASPAAQLPSVSTLEATPSPPGSTWNVNTFDEAMLFRYYVTDLARWFDDTDTQQHFAITLPQMAQDCHSLNHAILAFAAMQRHLEGEMGEASYLHYTDKCYKMLLPKIRERWKAFAPSALTSVFFLRIVQQMSSKSKDLWTQI